MMIPMHIATDRFSLRCNVILFFLLTVVVCQLTASGASASADRVPALQIDNEDSIVFIGNTFAERMHLFGYFETFLYSKFPNHQLRIRNMGSSEKE